MILRLAVKRIIAVALLSLLILSIIAAAQAQAITAKTNKSLYIAKEAMFVTGSGPANSEISVSVTNPNGNLVGMSSGNADYYGKFNITVLSFPSANSTTFPYGKYSVKVAVVASGSSITLSIIFASQRISATPNKASYLPSDLMFVTGIAPPDGDVTISVTNPGGSLVAVAQGKPDSNGKYNITIFRFPSSNSTTHPYGTYSIKATAAAAGASITVTAVFAAPPKIPTAIPKIQQVPASTPRVTDSFGNPISSISVGDLVTLEATVRNNDTVAHTFVYLVQVKDSNLVVDSLGWIRGISLDPGNSATPGLGWRPTKAGAYTIEVFIWESLNNPLALSPVGRITVTVG